MTPTQHEDLLLSYKKLLGKLSGDAIKTLLIPIIESVIEDVERLNKAKKIGSRNVF